MLLTFFLWRLEMNSSARERWPAPSPMSWRRACIMTSPVATAVRMVERRVAKSASMPPCVGGRRCESRKGPTLLRYAAYSAAYAAYRGSYPWGSLPTAISSRSSGGRSGMASSHMGRGRMAGPAGSARCVGGWMDGWMDGWPANEVCPAG
eukprot:jgi/Tetstr1/454202/TSEL_041121.t1